MCMPVAVFLVYMAVVVILLYILVVLPVVRIMKIVIVIEVEIVEMCHSLYFGRLLVAQLPCCFPLITGLLPALALNGCH